MVACTGMSGASRGPDGAAGIRDLNTRTVNDRFRVAEIGKGEGHSP
jgi:hypothetical protein